MRFGQMANNAKLYVGIIGLIVTIIVTINISTTGAADETWSSFAADPLIKKWTKAKVKAMVIEYNEVRKKWANDKEFRRKLSQLVVNVVMVAESPDGGPGKEVPLGAWGAGIMLQAMPQDILLESVVPHMNKGGRLEGFLDNADMDLIKHLEATSTHGLPPSFHHYEQYLAEHGIDESRGLFQYMCKTNLFRAGDVALRVAIKRERIKEDSETARNMRYVLGMLYMQSSSVRGSHQHNEKLADARAQLADTELWWVQYYLESLQDLDNDA